MAAIAVEVDAAGSERLAHILRDQMSKKNIGVQTVAKRSSMSPSTVNSYINNTRTQPKISLYSLVGIADAIHMDPLDLLSIVEGKATLVKQSQVDKARGVVAMRIARAASEANVNVRYAPLPVDDYAGDEPEPEQTQTHDIVRVPLNEVPSNADIMLLVRQLTKAEDRLLVHEILKEILEGNDGS